MTEQQTTLAERLDTVDAAQEAGVAVERRSKTVFDLIKDQRAGFERALPSMIGVDRFVRVAITTVRTNRRLAECEPMSLLGALTLSAQLGLEPGGPLGHAYLVPFRNRRTRKTDVTFIIGYKGYMELARRSGDIASIYAENVYDGDEFAWTLGLERTITHKPTAPDRDDPSKITHVYAVAKFKDGADPAFVVLTRAQVEKFRARSKSPSEGPWADDYPAMSAKTAVRRLSTWLPLSIEFARALSNDERVVDKLDIDIDDVIDVDGEEDADEVSPGAASTEQPGDEAPTPGPTEDSGAQNAKGKQ